jgi:hypothetical protein
MANVLTFYGWHRSGIYEFEPVNVDEGRLRATLRLTLRDRDRALTDVQRDVPFSIVAPRDVLGLQPSALGRMMPPPDNQNAETTKCVYVELNASDLPWRYTPMKASGLILRPWIVLVVGTPAEIQFPSPDRITFNTTVAKAHNLAQSARWAHVQDDGARRVTRLLSPRGLDELNAEYIAAIVPAFDDQARDAWAPDDSPTLPCYRAWRFRTGEAGDFRTLAARLHPAVADPSIGQAPLAYSRVSPPVTLHVRGALAPIGAADPPLQPTVAADVAVLLQPMTDPRGRPVIGLPHYDAPWPATSPPPPPPDGWAAMAKGDPRHRGAAGLGLWAGIELQEQLMDAAASQAGALDIAAQRIRHLTLGLVAARSLWQRRLPNDSGQRLFLYGPSLRRMVTSSGPVLEQITRTPGSTNRDRPLPPHLFSTAARRVLRAGPARTSLAAPGAVTPSAILARANECPPPPSRVSPGRPHTDAISAHFSRAPLDAAIRAGRLNGRDLAAAFARTAADPQWNQHLGNLVNFVIRAAEAPNQDRLPHFRVLQLLNAAATNDIEALIELRRGFESAEPDGPSLRILAKALVTEPPDRPCRPVANLQTLEEVVTAAIDPTVDPPLVQRRVLDGITGLEHQPLTPPEICVGLDLPVWTFLRDRAPDWLLPGVNRLEEDAVVALQSNPTFVDAFLLGLNVQVLGELRWRNVPIATGCTPMKMFWGQVDVADNARRPDIRGVDRWPATSPLGHPDHQPPPPAGTDLVLVFRSDLFRRYPLTLVYAAPAPMDAGAPNWQADPPFGGDRLLPMFQGRIGEDVTFFRFDLSPAAARACWVVLEESPPTYSFRNDVATGALDGAQFAVDTFHNPVRVLIRGQDLIAGA